MKRKDVIMRELLPDRRILTSAELKDVCTRYGFDFENTKKSLLNHGCLLRVFRGIYYLKDYEEQKTGVLKYSSRELLSLGLERKGIGNWYFGLETALKILNLTHEVFAVEYVINDSFNRLKPMKIDGTAFMFRRLKATLFFGISEFRTKNGVKLKYSELEKTLLDLAYLEKRAGRAGTAVASRIVDYLVDADKQKLFRYAKKYPKTIQDILLEALK